MTTYIGTGVRPVEIAFDGVNMWTANYDNNSVTKISLAKITLNWQIPSYDGGSAITNYEIYRGASSGGEIFLIEVGDILSYVDMGISDGVTYYYKVAAKNLFGIGAQSNEVSVIAQ